MKTKTQSAIGKIKSSHQAHIFIWIFSVVMLMTVLGFAGRQKKIVTCKKISVRIDESADGQFVTRADILDLLNSTSRQPLGKPVADINTAVLENLMNSNPYVERAEVYSTIDGTLAVEVWQRKPILRIINSQDEHFYMDNQGNYMPVSLNYSAHVIVANGNISLRYADGRIDKKANSNHSPTQNLGQQLFELARFLQEDDFWNAQMEQVYVNQDGEFELIPRVGNQRILLGNTENLKQKFNTLLAIYNHGFNNTGWNQYSAINLKYENQVVCTKTTATASAKLK